MIPKNEDDVRDIAIQCVNGFIKEGLIPDCTDTDDETEFEYQDIIVEVLLEKFNIERNE